MKPRHTLACLVLLFASPSAVAKEHTPRFTVAEVSVQSSAAKEAKTALRSSLTRTVAKLNGKECVGGPFLLSAALLTLRTSDGKYGRETTAQISTSVRHKKTGALVASTRGRATAIVPGGTKKDSEQSAVAAAVESAMSGLPDALAKSETISSN